ncbi:MAG: protein phosphatase CheZ [Pseudohongiella sp.]|nr:protein phosphatase CheZ [Pseudohongiella sp.]MDO9519548.1 protein phosphatase CheZ [Pseudohongiella sp.]
MTDQTDKSIQVHADAVAESFTTALRERTQALMDSLEVNDMASASELIRQINVARDETLYLEVGRLTRALHNAIRDFHLDIGLQANAQVEHELSEMADARSRLSYVMRMTEDAANQTMDKVDEAAPLAQAMVDESLALQHDWQHFLSTQNSIPPAQAELFARVDAHLNQVSRNGQGIHSRLTDILMAQGYQDLSGQVIKRVIELVSDVEQSLVRLVKLASNVEIVAGIQAPVRIASTDDSKQRIKAEGPQMNPSGNKDVVSGQDDVDELLSSLGF